MASKLLIPSLIGLCAILSNIILTSAKTDENVVTIKKYFESQGIPIDELPSTLADRYESNIVSTMSEINNGVYSLNNQHYTSLRLNSMILKSQKVNTATEPFTPEDETLLRALDLIVPNTGYVPIFESAKEDLRKFYVEQPSACRELLQRVREPLMAGQLLSEDVARYLRHFYNHWIPLGRLIKLKELQKI